MLLLSWHLLAFLWTLGLLVSCPLPVSLVSAPSLCPVQRHFRARGLCCCPGKGWGEGWARRS